MKKSTPYLISLLCLILALVPLHARATHAAGAEITYVWERDSTFHIYYHFYRDCKGIPEPGSVDLCITNSCGLSIVSPITLNKMISLPDGSDNGTEVLIPCPGRPTTCSSDTSTIPGYREWWYDNTVTLSGPCDYWTFSHGENARNSGIINLNVSSGSVVLYVEATLNNKDAPQNSSAYFTVKPVPYICNNNPYTYNNGAYDNNGDSLNFECLNPQTASGSCPPSSDVSYVSTTVPVICCSLPSNPLPCGGTFVFSSTTGQMSFTPNETGPSVLTVRANEWRNISGTWKKVGSVMRDIQVIVRPCNTPLPTAAPVPGSVIGCSLASGIINACATIPMSFCYDAKTSQAGHILTVKDNHKAFSGPPTISYIGIFTDSIRGCFYWTPSYRDTGLKIYTVTITDSTCTGVGIPLSATYAIPIHIWPVTQILSDTIICPGDSVRLQAIGGGGFRWGIDSSVYTGSTTATMSDTAGTYITVKPTVTTRYTVYSSSNIYCSKTRDTVTVLVVPAPKKLTIDTAACVGSTIQLFVPDTTPTAGISVKFKWAPPTYLSNANVQNPFCTPFADALYSATVTYGGVSKCPTVATVHVKALHYFKLLTRDTSVCKNVPITVNATGDPEYAYTWTPSFGVSNISSLTPIITADTTRTYTVTARHVACPDSSASFTLTVEQTPLVSVGQPKTICSGDTLHMFGIVVPNTYPYTYKWTPDTSVTNPTAQNTIFKGIVTTKLVFTATTGAGCKGSDSVVISVLPSKFLKVSQDTGICPGDTARLRVGGDSIVSVRWTAAPYNIDDSNSYTPSAWPSLSQNYVVYGRNAKNCRDTQSIHVTVNPAAVINIPDSVILYPGNSYQINPEGNCMYYTWTPPYGLNVTNISNPTAKPDVNTRYYAHGVTEAGCKATDSIDIYVADDSYINVPNAFTPGSGPGSTLKVLHLGDATLKNFAIYNRWGIKMFATGNVNEGWDGKFNGQPQPLGVYVYTVEAYTAKGKRVYKQGNITLFR